MMKKFQKNFLPICLFVFLFVVFTFILTTKAIAIEIQYPVISGQTVNTTTELPDYVKYLFNAGVFIGFFAVFISLVIAGVMYIMSPVNAGLRANAKDRVSGSVSGTLILLMTYLIITTINPQLSILYIKKLPPSPPPQAPKLDPGVYLYSNPSDCPDKDAQLALVSSVASLDALKNKIKMVSIVQGSGDNKTSYVSILYKNINFWGECQYINPNQPCQSALDATNKPFASSASVHIYDSAPNGDGIYFYRKSCLNNQISGNIDDLVKYCNKNSGGYFKVDNSEILRSANSGMVYVRKLDDLKFQNVPQDQQDCIKYDKDGICTGRSVPSLGAENVSSIIIKGNYLVLLYYSGPSDKNSGPWTSCQEFPTSDDVNMLGPQQIKWENIRSNGDVVPNHVMVVPIK